MKITGMEQDLALNRWPSRREMTFAARGMVCTTQPLAAGAGLDALKAGGNAVDAAVAAAAAMTVTEPTSNGLGSDAFAIVWIEREHRLYGLNASGRAPMSLTAEALRAMGLKEVPQRGWAPVMVPGAPAAWAAVTERFGRRSLAENLEAAAAYAEEGYPVGPLTARSWQSACRLYAAEREQAGDPAWFRPWFDCFAPDGHAPAPGETWRCPDMARSLRLIGATGAEAFYRGELAEAMDAFSRETGGWLRREDLAAYRPEWVEPVSVPYRGFDVWELPPNGDGIVALMALGILGRLPVDPARGRDDEANVHLQLEAIKKAFADGEAFIADPDAMTVRVEELLSGAYAARRAAEIGPRAAEPACGDPSASGTIYLCTADGEGNMVSWIQSNYRGFGSGVVVPGTGISLQDRGNCFSLDPASPNVLAPGKRAFHTIIPGFLTRGGEAVGPFGVMGGFMQPQGHVQVVMNMIDFGLNPQEALDAPRWQWVGGKRFLLEPEWPRETAGALRARGHEIEFAESRVSFGRGEIILRMDNGMLAGACEPRAAGCCAAW